MSTAPLGLVAGWELSTVAPRARRAAAVMHDDPLVGDGAAVMAVAVADTAGRSGLVAPEVFVGRLAGHLGQWQVPPQLAARLAGQPRLATTAGALASLGGTAGSGQRPQPAAGQHTGEARSAIRIGDRPRVRTGSGGKGHR